MRRQSAPLGTEPPLTTLPAQPFQHLRHPAVRHRPWSATRHRRQHRRPTAGLLHLPCLLPRPQPPLPQRDPSLPARRQTLHPVPKACSRRIPLSRQPRQTLCRTRTRQPRGRRRPHQCQRRPAQRSICRHPAFQDIGTRPLQHADRPVAVLSPQYRVQRNLLHRLGTAPIPPARHTRIRCRPQPHATPARQRRLAHRPAAILRQHLSATLRPDSRQRRSGALRHRDYWPRHLQRRHHPNSRRQSPPREVCRAV